MRYSLNNSLHSMPDLRVGTMLHNDKLKSKHSHTYPSSYIYLNIIIYQTILCVIFGCLTPVTGELCWSYQDSDNLCRDYLMHTDSKEKCCSMNSVSVAYTVKELDTDRIFLWNFVEKKGAPDCQRCHTNCSSVKCPVDKKCLLDDNGYPECVCDQDCSDEMKNSGPICGTDIQTYPSTCALRQETCKRGRNVELEYYGKCQDSCRDVQCPNGKYCVPDQNTLPHCISCNNICSNNETMALRETCGTDNVTYYSICGLRRGNCESTTNIGIGYEGPCRDIKNCSDQITCPDRQTCLKDQTATTNVRCVDCMSGCLESGYQICGSNLKTYPDWCAMQKESCTTGIYVEAIHPGRCVVDIIRESGNGSSLDYHNPDYKPTTLPQYPENLDI